MLINAGLHRAEEIAEAVFTYLRGKKAPPPAVQSWTLIPDAGVSIVLASSLVYSRHAWIQLRRGERRFGSRLGFLKVARTVLFGFIR